jgi:hypothetical protein
VLGNDTFVSGFCCQAEAQELTARSAWWATRAFSSEVDTGSREEHASKQESGASVLIQSEPKML